MSRIQQGRSIRGMLSLAAALLLASWQTTALAGQLRTFVLDVPNSIVTVTGTLTAGNTSLPIKSQVPGSLLTTLAGTLEADIVPGVSVSLLGGGSVVPIVQPGDFLPGSAPADLAGRVLNILPGIHAYGAFRSDELDFSSLSPMPLNGLGQFDAGPVVTSFLAGQFDYSIGAILNNSFAVGGSTFINDGGVLGQLRVIGSQYQLVVPLQTTLLFSEQGFDLSIDLEGRLVAYARVPEPASLWLAGSAVALLMLVAARRHC